MHFFSPGEFITVNSYAFFIAGEFLTVNPYAFFIAGEANIEWGEGGNTNSGVNMHN